MTAHPPTVHPQQSAQPAQPPSASTPALPVDELGGVSGSGGPAGSGAGERFIDRVEHSDIVRIAVVGLAVLGAWAAGAAGTPGWAVGAVGAAALVTLLATRDVRATISVIIVAGACGVAAGTPLAVLAAIARAARCGAFVKDGTHLEQLSAVDTVVLDKTGTLTVGAPRVVSVGLVGAAAEPAVDSAAGEDEVLALAAAAEWDSEHPIGRAIRTEAAVRDLTVPVPDDVVYSPGAGVSALVEGHRVTVGRREDQEDRGQARIASADDDTDDTDDTAAPIASDFASDPEAPSATSVVEVRVDGRPLGTITLADRLRQGAATAVRDLGSMGLEVLMLTGDSSAFILNSARLVPRPARRR